MARVKRGSDKSSVIRSCRWIFLNCSCVDLLAVDDVGRAGSRSEGAFTKNRDRGQNEQEAEVRKQNLSE